MPCELIPRTVNSKHIAVELELNGAERKTMYVERLERGKTLRLSDGFAVESERQYGPTHHQDDREDSLEELNEKHNPKTSQKEILYGALGYKTLPRIFATFEDFGVIHETESNTSVTSEWSSVPSMQQNHISRRKSTTNSRSKTIQAKVPQGDSSPTINRRQDSEELALCSTRGVLSSVQYHKSDSEVIFDEHSSERKNGHHRVLDQVTGELAIVSNSSRRSSFTAMNAIPEALIDSRRFYSLPRKLSVPVENHRATVNRNGKRQRNSIPTNSSYSVRSFVLDDDTNDQWEKLVERAKSFQMFPKKKPVKMMDSKGENVYIGNMRKGFTSSVKESFDRSSRVDEYSEAIEKKEGREFVEITQPSTSQGKQTLSEKHMEDETKSSNEIETKEHSSIPSREKEALKSGQVDLGVNYIPNNHTFDSKLQMNKGSRRYSLATINPSPEVREKISGYSTHGALEYARMLLGKIQTEGKSKSKKERLDEMSKALKMVLDELNRIEVPDRDLVSLFISLRAKIVNLKDDLKTEEKEIKFDEETEKNVSVLSKTLMTRVRNTTDNVGPPAHLRRRFSWC